MTQLSVRGPVLKIKYFLNYINSLSYLLDYNKMLLKNLMPYVHQISLVIIKIKNYNIEEDYLK